MADDALFDPFGLRCVVAVPIRSFEFGKARLASALTDDTRRALVRSMAERVVSAAGRLTVVVVTSDAEVAAWARSLMAFVLDDPGSLDDAASVARRWARERGAERVVVAHGDLPFADDLEHLAAPGSARIALIVPDRIEDGTPVLSIPTDGPFTFRYGVGSFAAHCDEARRSGLDVDIVRDPTLRFDVDEQADLAALGFPSQEHTQ